MARMEKVKIYDTTLRDGMQTEGLSFSLEDKLLIARRLDQFGIDYVEGGYPASNPKEMQFFDALRSEPLKSARLVAFGSTRRADRSPEDDAGLAAIVQSGAPAATLVGKCWDLHVNDVLRCSLDENLRLCGDSIRYLKGKGLEVFFDAEHFFDGYRRNPEYAMQVIRVATEAGADAIVLCETNGGCLPDDVHEITRAVCWDFPHAMVGIHCHNDADCAVAATLAAVTAGARQVQGTINGLGERAGNANLCSIIPNLTLKMGFATVPPERLRSLTELSRFVSEVANLPPAAHMPYVGESAFAHKAGLHVDALRKNKTTYEHIDPADVGNSRRFLVSELSGASTVMAMLDRHGLADNKALARKLVKQVQDLENEGYQFEAADASFDLLVKKALGAYKPAFELVKYHVDVECTAEGQIVTEASVKLKVDGTVEHVVSEGDGPVNALDSALRKSLLRFYPCIADMRLIDYKVRVVNAKEGTAAKVRVIIETRDHDALWSTVGVSENIIEASWKALVDSVEYRLLKHAAGK